MWELEIGAIQFVSVTSDEVSKLSSIIRSTIKQNVLQIQSLDNVHVDSSDILHGDQR